MRAALVVTIALAAISGCKKEGQSFAEGMRIVCQAPDHVPGTSAAQKATALAAYIDQNVSNEEVKKTIRELSLSEGSAKRRVLEEAAGRAGLDRCALAELWEMPSTVPPGYQPPPAEPQPEETAAEEAEGDPATEEPAAEDPATGEPAAEDPAGAGDAE
ncbi:MAG TPA: hypothetical protein VKZ63_14315 [Kofleriaceae bacterium]|nr:hypothetical protein [Kofleriaceae bacterium]